MNKMKKTLVILGLGLSGMFAGSANAFSNPSSCSQLKQQCEEGNQGSCFLWNSQGCWVCETNLSLLACQ
jgi:hypothetical protein